MKKLLFFAILAFSINFNVLGQVYKTINVGTAGTLNSLLTQTEKNTVTNLTVTGNINALDFSAISEYMTSVAVFDISAVTIQSFTGNITIISGIMVDLASGLPTKFLLLTVRVFIV